MKVANHFEHQSVVLLAMSNCCITLTVNLTLFKPNSVVADVLGLAK